MNTPANPPTPAQELFEVISPIRRKAVEADNAALLAPGVPFRLPTDQEAEDAMILLLRQITELDARHNKGKNISDDQLAEQVFRKDPRFADHRQFLPYARYQLRVAHIELNRLVDTMRESGGGRLTYEILWDFRDFINDYLFDCREILGPIQKNVADWKFFDGHKNSGVTSWEIFRLANNLAWQSTVNEPGQRLTHKTAQIAAIVVLRQAMEKRFERLISVYPVDRNGKGPKLKHGFHQDFISKYPSFFASEGFEIAKLRHLYDWCSEIVHQAYQPYTWLITFALRRAGALLRSKAAAEGERWSIFNAVRIADIDAMQTAYENHFLETYGHGEWKFFRDKPEAIVEGWQDNMRKLSLTFVAVRNPAQGGGP